MYRHKIIRIIVALLVGSINGLGCANEEILPADQAFQLSAQQHKDAVLLHWNIAEGYYLYRDKYRFSSNSSAITLKSPQVPQGKQKHDEYFGDVEIHRGQIEIVLPVVVGADAGSILDLNVTYQGCADLGVCYPPIQKNLRLNLPDQPSQSTQIPSDFRPQQRSFGLNLLQQELLPADQAFRFVPEVKNGNSIRVSWEIAEGYYLYREKFGFELKEDSAIQIGPIDIPRGTPEYDEAFGQVEIFHDTVGFELPLIRNWNGPATVQLIARFQGCAERGVCYPPMEKSVSLKLPASAEAPDSRGSIQKTQQLSEQDQIAASLLRDSLLFTVLSFFGFGLLLAFTPCVFPMIPILSGMIVGQGESMTTARAFLLSLCYVLASAATYTVFGIVAGLFGGNFNLQALFQTPVVIIVFSAIFVLLALSMFGFYNLQMPASIQSRIAALGQGRDGGNALAAAIMGALSALIVGPCVAAPLAGALIYIGQTGDAVLGGLALFAMGLGMGFPLLIIGTSAGKLLPKTGTWMNATKAVFGVLLLAVAVWLLGRIVPPAVSMLLWAVLLIIPAVYLHAMDVLPETASGWSRLWKGCGVIMLTAGILLIIGVASGSRDPFRPLNKLAGGSLADQSAHVVFTRVSSSRDLDLQLKKASERGQWVMLDYYADWCVSCKEMEYYTFSDPRVQQLMSQMVLVQADVTVNSTESKELLSRFDLIGPPAILFFEPGSRERRALRVVGYKDADSFITHLRQFLSNA